MKHSPTYNLIDPPGEADDTILLVARIVQRCDNPSDIPRNGLPMPRGIKDHPYHRTKSFDLTISIKTQRVQFTRELSQ